MSSFLHVNDYIDIYLQIKSKRLKAVGVLEYIHVEPAISDEKSTIFCIKMLVNGVSPLKMFIIVSCQPFCKAPVLHSHTCIMQVAVTEPTCYIGLMHYLSCIRQQKVTRCNILQS